MLLRGAAPGTPHLSLPTLAEEWVRGTLRDPAQHFRTRRRRSCPCCEYEGLFVSSGWRGAPDFRCPNCSSRPRDRQIALYLKTTGIGLRGKKILHFAPEWPLFRQLRREPGYVGGDIIRRRNANARVDITNIAFGSDHFDVLICNHVLEHVPDDRRAMREAFRVLKPGGLAIFSVPMSSAPTTWEPTPGMSRREVEKICGWDHKRLYGQDFPKKLGTAGFRVQSFTATPEEQRACALLPETIFVAHK